jgi:ubiquitin C-terminal hydrolase
MTSFLLQIQALKILMLHKFTVTNLTFCPTLNSLTRFVNTCYFNAALQTLFADDIFVETLLSVPSRGLVRELQQLIHENIRLSYVTDEAIWTAFCSIGRRLPQFADNKQQSCCSEFMELLLNAIAEDAPENGLKDFFEVLLQLHGTCRL